MSEEDVNTCLRQFGLKKDDMVLSVDLAMWKMVKVLDSPYLSAHFIHITATAPSPMTIEIINIAMFCHKVNLSAKKAKNSKIKTSQQTPTTTVPATLEPSEFIVKYLNETCNISFALACLVD